MIAALTAIIKKAEKALVYREALIFIGQGCSTVLERPCSFPPSLKSREIGSADFMLHENAAGRSKTILVLDHDGLTHFVECSETIQTGNQQDQ